MEKYERSLDSIKRIFERKSVFKGKQNKIIDEKIFTKKID